MRSRITLAGLFAVLLIAGCGDRRVLVGVDALSFTNPADRDRAFGPVPVLASPVLTGELPIFDDLHVNMFGGSDQLVDVQSVTVALSADIADSTGDGLDTLRVYLSDSATSPTSTPPVLAVPFALVPGQHTPVDAVVSGDPRVISLFTQDQMRVTLTTSLRGPSSGQPLNGRATITRLRADVVARHHSL